MRRGIGFLAGAFVAVALSACGGGEGEGGSEGAAGGGSGEQSGSAIKFGFLGGVTGDYAPWTGPALEAVEIAQQEINDAGGVLGRRLDIVIADNKSTVEGAVSGFRKLVEVDQVPAISGLESDAAVALIDATSESKIPAMCPQCGTNELDEKGGDFIFRQVVSDTDLGIITAQMARDEGHTRMAVLTQKTEGSLSEREAFLDAWTNGVGGEVINDVQFDPGKQTYQAEVQQAFSGNPDAVYVASGFEAGIPLLREWNRRGYGGTVYLSPAMLVPEIAGLGSFVENGAVIGATPVFNTDGPAYQSFAERYEAATGNPPTPSLWEAGQYDAIINLALATTAAGEANGQAIRDKIVEVANEPGTECTSYSECVELLEGGEDIDYEGASTELEYNEFGNLATAPMGESHAQGGNWVQVEVHQLDAALKEKVLSD